MRRASDVVSMLSDVYMCVICWRQPKEFGDRLEQVVTDAHEFPPAPAKNLDWWTGGAKTAASSQRAATTPSPPEASAADADADVDAQRSASDNATTSDASATTNETPSDAAAPPPTMHVRRLREEDQYALVPVGPVIDHEPSESAVADGALRFAPCRFCLLVCRLLNSLSSRLRTR